MLKQYEDKLYGCRFCPMCKPAGEVANLTQFESHTTRARAMMLWRILQGAIDWTPRAVELLYQSTLDSISEAWCVSHYPVSAYVLAARAEVYAAGLAPEAVRQALAVSAPVAAGGPCGTLLLASEIAEWGDEALAAPALRALQWAGAAAQPVFAHSGALTYTLGAHDRAREQAAQVVALIRDSGARTVIADGPQTLWALRCVYPVLGIELPAGTTVVSLLEYLADALRAGELAVQNQVGGRALLHDSRTAALLADTLPLAETIQPGYVGDEAKLGTGAIYDAPRTLARALGIDALYSVWTRALSRSSGADDGLWRTYPALADGLARQRLRAARDLGAALVVTDSALHAAHLGRFAGEFDLQVRWLAELLAGAAS